MSYELALAHLKEQYPGRLVLYPRDLAQILGRSEQSVSHLLDRGNLPFKVKKVGRERCVDFFQVAQWLTAGDEEENPPEKPTTQARAAGARSKRASTQAAPLTPMMAELLQMRHDAPRALARLAAQLEDQDERSFMTEVAHQMMFIRAAGTSEFVVTLKRQEVVPGGFSSAEERLYFDDYGAADSCVSSLKGGQHGEASVRIQLKKGWKLLQHFSYLDGVWLNLS